MHTYTIQDYQLYYWFYQITRNSHLPECEAKNALINDGVDISSLKLICELFTRRIEIDLDDHILVIDTNMYNDAIDYDLEIESKVSKEHAKETILKYCDQFGLEYKTHYLTKVQRAFNTIK